MDLTERITIDPEICPGKPTIRGLRYSVETILELLRSGMTIEEILADYEDLEHEDIIAALHYTASHPDSPRIAAWGLGITNNSTSLSPRTRA